MVSKELNDNNSLSQFLISPHSAGGGGLCLLWNKDINIQVLASCNNYIDTLITFKNSSFYGTFVYGAPEIPNRNEIWNQLTDVALSRISPWFLTGDFNEIVDNSEKEGGPVRAENTFVSFRSFLSASDLFDIQHTGNFLSWRGKRHTHVVHCRLDRAIANSKWFDLFPTARSHYLGFEGSDHIPILSILDPTKLKPKRIFRYDRRLRYNSEVSHLIKEAWNKEPNLPVADRIANCRREIAKWSREHYVNSRKRIDSLKESLDIEMSRYTANDALIFTLNNDLLMAYRAEEEYWK